MDAIKDIKAGEQIWNTYGDPPNSELLRRYGYVDFIPCDKPGYNFPFENPEDDVEIRADLILDICAPSIQGEARVQKIDVWLTLGGDEYVRSFLFIIQKIDTQKYICNQQRRPTMQAYVRVDSIPFHEPSGNRRGHIKG